MTLGISRGELFDAFVDAARSTGAIKLPDDPQRLADLRQEFEHRAADPVGRAHVAVGGAKPMSTTAPVIIPTEPPGWAQRATNLTAEGSSRTRRTQLLTAQAAESKAAENLRSIVEALPLDATHTLGDAARQDPAVERAINRAMRRAHIYKIDYLPDGAAGVSVTIDPRDVWDELREIPER